MPTLSLSRHPALLTGLLAALALAACSKPNDSHTVGQKLDAAIATVDQKADTAAAEVKRESEQARQSTDRALNDVKQATTLATQSAAAAVSDSGITAAVKGKLASDLGLRGMTISVETHGARTTLTGSVPTQAARTYAEQIVASVTGVAGVDNQLKLAP